MAHHLRNIRFSQTSALSVSDYQQDVATLTAYPNPMTTQTTIQFTANQSETVQFVMYNQLGKQVYKQSYSAVTGKNSIEVTRNQLTSGLYFCRIISSQFNYDTFKLIIK